MPTKMNHKPVSRISQQNSEPLVSVIALCFNHSSYVIEALESFRHQTYRNTQLIIFDDCSSDNSVKLIKDWINEHQLSCLFIAHEINQGLIKTINEGILLATGKYIACSSTDDVWILDKLEHQVSHMEKLPEDVGVLYSDAYRIDVNGNKYEKLFIETYRQFSNIPTGNIFPELLKGNFIPVTATLVRRSCYDKVGLYDENLCYEDWDMWLRIASHYQFFFSDKISAYYRVVPNSLSQHLFTSKNISVALSDFNMFIKYYDDSTVRAHHKQLLADKLTSLAYILNDLRFNKRSTILYQAWKYDFRKKTFILWILAFLKIIPQSAEEKVRCFLDHPSHQIKSFLRSFIRHLPEPLQQKIRISFNKIKNCLRNKT